MEEAKKTKLIIAGSVVVGLILLSIPAYAIYQNVRSMVDGADDDFLPCGNDFLLPTGECISRDELEALNEEEPDVSTDENEVPTTVRTEELSNERINCDHNVQCFLEGLDQSTNVYLTNEVSRQLFTGVTLYSAQNISYNNETFTLDVPVSRVLFEDGWYNTPNEVTSDPYWQREIEDAKAFQGFSEEEYAQLSSDVKALYDGWKSEGLSNAEIGQRFIYLEIEASIEATLGGLSGLEARCVSMNAGTIQDWIRGTAPTYDLTTLDFESPSCTVSR